MLIDYKIKHKYLKSYKIEYSFLLVLCVALFYLYLLSKPIFDNL